MSNKGRGIEATGVRTPATAKQISLARDLYGTDEVEVDDNATQASTTEGVWVSAWVWLSEEWVDS